MLKNTKFNKDREGFFLISTGYSYGINQEEESNFIQLGLLYLGTVLKKKGYKVKILCTYYPDIDEIKETIKNENIRIVGFYTTTENIYRCFNCASVLKEEFSPIKIIMGGPYATAMDKAILEEEESVDLIVRGEGENTISELAEFFFEGTGELENIKGITYRKDGDISSNPDRPFIEDPDIIPIPDRDLLEEPLRSFDRIYPRITTGRGCPFKCAFCYEGSSGSRYRFRSPENVLKEIDYLMERGDLKYIRFMDDTFTAKPGRTLKICKGLRDRSEGGKKFVWFAEGRVDILSKNPRLIYEMSMAGLVNLHIGVECADQRVLDIYRKNITLEQIETVVKISADALIPIISMNFIIGGPLESEEIYKKNLAFVKKLMEIAPGRIFVTSALLVPFPGTQIREFPEKFGLSIIDHECKMGMTNETCYAETENMNKYELIKYKRKFDREVDRLFVEMSNNIPRDVIFQHMGLQYYSIKSNLWHILSFDVGIRKFFNLISHKTYFTLDDIIDRKDILDFCPTATYLLNYNKDNLVFFPKLYGEEVLDPIESQLYEYSSGKFTFREIIDIAKEKIFKEESPEEVYRKIIDFYRRIDKFYAIIFARV